MYHQADILYMPYDTAFKKIYSKADCPLIWPRVLQLDRGSEFKDEDAKELLTDSVNTAWVMNLSDIVNELNNSNTRLLGMSPVEAIQKDQVYALPLKIWKDRPVGAEEICLPAGSLVKYLLDSSDYQGRKRATDPIWSTKVYTIESSTVVDRQRVVPSDTMLPPTHILY
ncbi:hypothetical protein C1646_775289 [Rhizophagus diaphanus]|nr:hypothetical protein C1646_775289 [Rhizophagus diaphanus] [Rhizophagus sp. MUCL 43196]